MKYLIILLILSVVPIFASDLSWSPDTSYAPPSYSDHTLMSVGDLICISNIKIKDKQGLDTLKGLLVITSTKQKECNLILEIKPDTLVKPHTEYEHRMDYSCCSMKYEYFKDRYKRCMTGNGRLYYEAKSCEMVENVTKYSKKPIWVTTYGPVELAVKEDDKDSGKRYIGVKSTENIVVSYGETVEVFRNDGTLRFRGNYKLGDDFFHVTGHCYTKNGKQGRYVNNADFCK